MIFQERLNGDTYIYDVEDVFGKVRIESFQTISPDLLDELVMFLLKQNTKAQTVNGEVKHENGVIKYTFEKTPMWSDDDEEEEPKQEPIPEPVKKQSLWQWIKRFRKSLKEAWKQSDKY